MKWYLELISRLFHNLSQEFSELFGEADSHGFVVNELSQEVQGFFIVHLLKACHEGISDSFRVVDISPILQEIKTTPHVQGLECC